MIISFSLALVFTAFFVVANPEALVVRQTERTLTALTDTGFSVHGLIINRIAVSDGSEYLQRTEENQGPYIRRLLLLGDQIAVGRVYLTLEEIRGVQPLLSIGDSLTKELGLI